MNDIFNGMEVMKDILNDIIFIGINNPRLSNGDFGSVVCDKCGGHSSAFTCIQVVAHPIILCKSCLLDAVDVIDRTTLNDCIEKGRERHDR